MTESKYDDLSNVTKKHETKVFSKKYLTIRFLMLFLVEFLLIVFWGVVNIILTLVRSSMIGLNIGLGSSTQFFMMFFDFVESWFTIPLIIILFVGIPFLCSSFMKYLYDIKQNIIEINENYKKLVENQKN